MPAALALSAFLASVLTAVQPSPGDADSAARWGGSWIMHGTHRTAEPGSSGNADTGERGVLRNCHGIKGSQIAYVECEFGPDGKRNIFNAVVPGDPGSPAVTPEMLMQEALRLLTPPAPEIVTAPPRERSGT